MHITSCIWNAWLISYLIANNSALVNKMFLTLILDIMNIVLELLDEFWQKFLNLLRWAVLASAFL